jgi:hypothetical protein
MKPEYRTVEYRWSEVEKLASASERVLLAGGFFATWAKHQDGYEGFCVLVDLDIKEKLTEEQFKAIVLHEEAHILFDADAIKESGETLLIDIEAEMRADQHAIENGSTAEELFSAVCAVLNIFFKRMGCNKSARKEKVKEIKNTMLRLPYYQGLAA